jgi:hypothetical protein
MATPPSIGNPTADPQLLRYYQQIDDLTGRALAGDIDERGFQQELNRLTTAAILLLFLLGGGDVGSPAGARQLAQHQQIARESAARLASDIFDGRYSADGRQTGEDGREKLRNRLVLWTVTAAGVYALGQVHTAPAVGQGGQFAEARYRWTRGPTARPCRDCAGLDGVVLTASEWARMGIRPQSPSLNCGGWRCLCRLELTDEPSVTFEGVPT